MESANYKHVYYGYVLTVKDGAIDGVSLYRGNVDLTPQTQTDKLQNEPLDDQPRPS